MKYRKLSKAEKKKINQQKQQVTYTENRFIFKNPNNAVLSLPRKPVNKDTNRVGPNEEFEGDDYFLNLAHQGMFTFVRHVKKEEKVPEQKLILDQPDQVTEMGAVEHVVNPNPAQKLQKPLTEHGESKSAPKVLLNENPVEDGFIIIED